LLTKSNRKGGFAEQKRKNRPFLLTDTSVKRLEKNRNSEPSRSKYALLPSKLRTFTEQTPHVNRVCCVHSRQKQCTFPAETYYLLPEKILTSASKVGIFLRKGVKSTNIYTVLRVKEVLNLNLVA